MDGRPPLEPEIDRYYSEEWDEDARIRSGLNELEYVRTQEIVRRHLPDGPLRILDVGGGGGVHAEWLLGDGHTVTLVDPVQRHVDIAIDNLGRLAEFSASLGDARSLAFEDDAFDAVLLLGPLYHLTKHDDRIRAWNEASRVATSGGLVVAAGITRFASLFSGLNESDVFVDDFRRVVEQDLVDGQHRNVDDRDYFTTAFFHHPDELLSEARAAGFDDPVVISVEGPIGAVPQLAESWKDPERRAVLLDLVRRVESERSLMGIGPHLIVVMSNP